jgi:transketolase
MSNNIHDKNSGDTEALAKRLRIHALNMTSRGGSSHIGSAFSIADIVALLYGKILKKNVKDPKDPNRDRFILSKGHAGCIVYAALAEVGFFDTKKLKNHYMDGSDLSGHISHLIPGVEFSTGSLGHGLSVGVGMALSAKMKFSKHRVYVLLSDGECDEGSNWEAILFASHHKLTNLIAIIDYNKIQSLDSVEKVLDLEPFAEKWRSFGWSVIEVDGHSHNQLHEALSKSPESEKPTVIIAHTTKGKGVSFMENTVLWHYRCAKNEEYNLALKELEDES